jgi:hypothetical protein
LPILKPGVEKTLTLAGNRGLQGKTSAAPPKRLRSRNPFTAIVKKIEAIETPSLLRKARWSR